MSCLCGRTAVWSCMCGRKAVWTCLCGRKAVWSCMCGRKYNSIKKISIAPNMNQNIYIYIYIYSADFSSSKGFHKFIIGTPYDTCLMYRYIAPMKYKSIKQCHHCILTA